MKKGKIQTFNGLYGFIKGDDGFTYHFMKNDFNEFCRNDLRWLRRKRRRNTPCEFISYEREGTRMQGATNIIFKADREAKTDETV